MSFFTELAGLTPHGFCLAWQPGLVWVMAVSNLLTAAAYFSIPAALLTFLAKRRDVVYRPIFALFACFILACGSTHVMGAVTLWLPFYWLDAAVSALTAALSVATAIALWPLVPKAVALPSPDKLRALNQELALKVAQRDHAMDQLNFSRERLRRLYAHSPAPLQATDCGGMLVEVSDQWLDLAGRRREDVIGHDIAEFYEPDSAADAAHHLLELCSGTGDLFGRRIMRRGDGQLRTVDLVYQPELDAAGELCGMLAAVTDVSARLAAEAALKQSEEHLRQAQKMEAVGQLTGGIAHDFNNLLTSIIGSLELLEDQAGLDHRGQRLANNALAASRRAARLTSQLLSFSRRQLLAPEALLPQDIEAGIHDLLARSLGERIVFEVVPAEAGQWPLLADRNQAEAALLNLVINARDAIDGDGRVTIDFANVAADPHEEDTPSHEGDGVVATGGYCRIRVTDTGCGMSETTRARAFDPFFTTKPQGAGTGLGLSQIYGFVTQSLGHVHIDSAPGQGTSVSIFLPRAVVPAREWPLNDKPAQAPLPIWGGSGDGQRLLFVEDDDLLRETIREALAGRHYAVCVAADGQEALELLQGGQEFAMMITDVRMPGHLNGVQLATAARALYPHLPVLFATGYAETALFATWAEPLDLLAKPYTVENLLASIGRKLRDQQQGRLPGMPQGHDRQAMDGRSGASL